MVDILSAPHNAHQWQATACVLCLLAVPILLHCVRHCLLLVTRCMRPLQKWSTNLDPTSATLSLLVASVTNVHTSCRPHFIIFLSSVSIDLPCGASVFTVLCYSFAHSLTPRLSFCIILPKNSARPCGDLTNSTRLMHTCQVYVNCVVLLRQPATQLSKAEGGPIYLSG